MALLDPEGRELVLDWLVHNGFGVPDQAIPILRSYVEGKWWVIAARIHPEALVDVTRDAAWKRPFLVDAATEILADGPSLSDLETICRQLGYAEAVGPLLALWKDDLPTRAQVVLLDALLWTKSERALPLIERVLKEVWPSRSASEWGQAPRLDSQDVADYAESNEEILDVMAEVLRDPTLPLDYRALLACAGPADRDERFKAFLVDLRRMNPTESMRRAVDERLRRLGVRAEVR